MFKQFLSRTLTRMMCSKNHVEDCGSVMIFGAFVFNYKKNCRYLNVDLVWYNCMKLTLHLPCDFDRASSLICGNIRPTRCNRCFYCRSYCLFNMFRAPLCPSSGAQEYYTVVAACGISCCGFSSSWSGVELRVMCPVCRMLVFSWSGVELRVMCPVCRMLQHPANRIHQTSYLKNHRTKYHRQQPLYNTLELLMMGIVMPETCRASNKICNKNLCCI